MIYTSLITAIALCYLIIAYFPITQLAFLQNYQLVIDINNAFGKVISYTSVITIIGVIFLVLVLKFTPPCLDKEIKKYQTAAKAVTLSTYLVMVGLAASLLILAVSAFYASGFYGLLVKPQPWTAEELERIAIHEAGHAVMREIEYPGSTKKAVIAEPAEIVNANNWFSQSIPSGFVVGESPSRLPTKEQLLKNIRIYLAGLAAEKIIYGTDHAYIGAGDDLDKVNELVIKLYDNGLVSDSPLIWSALSAQEKSAAYKEIVEPQYRQVNKLLTEYEQEIRAVAEALQKKKTLTGDEIQKLIREN